MTSLDLEFSPEQLLDVSSLIDILIYRALHQPKQTAYTFLQNGETESARLTYQELDTQARAIAASLQSLTAKGERALLLYPSGLEFIAAFFGCLYAGVVAVPAYPPRRNQKISRLQAIVTDAQATLVLTTKELLADIQQRLVETSELAPVFCLATNDLPESQAELWQKPALDRNNLAFLQYTSGSTGTPKGVMVTHGNLLYNERMIQQSFGHSETTIVVGWLPFYHDMGLIGNVLQPMYLGRPCILMPPVAFLQKPICWLQAISRYRATTSGGPNFAYDLCVRKITPEQRAGLDLSNWEIAFCGAEPVQAQTISQFARTFGPCGFRREAFYPCYGMAETTLLVSGGTKTKSPIIRWVKRDLLLQNQVMAATEEEDSQGFVGCGRTWLEQKIVIVDPKSLTLCPPNQVGEIWVSGQNVAQGYWKQPKKTEETFQAYLADTGEGPFLRTGDLGFLQDGELFITGRQKDLIIIFGRNHYPQDIERTVEQSHTALNPGGGAAFAVEINNSEKLVIVQEVKRSYLRKLNTNEVIGAIRQAVTEEHDLQAHTILLLKTGSLPKTSSGKVQRSACRAGFKAGSLNVVADWSTNIQYKNQFQHLESEIEFLLQKVKAGNLQAKADESKKPPVAHPQLEETQKSGSFRQLEGFESKNSTKNSALAKAIEAWLIAKVAEQLQVPLQEIDIRQPLAQYGLSSLAAVRISGELQEKLGSQLSPTLLYNYPTIEALVQYLTDKVSIFQDLTPQKVSGKSLKENEAIAIIGIGCRFPKAKNPEAFWQLLSDGVDAISNVPASRWDANAFYDPNLTKPNKMNTRWGGFLEQVDQFDPQFFGISPREAESMDPQQRLLLEVSWEALENAGQAPEQLANSQTGVFIGISNFDYAQLHLNHSAFLNAYSATGNAFSLAANRLSYFLDLKGPSLAINTACSSSLVAVHQACQSLYQGECNLALVGGVNLILNPQGTIIFSQAKMMAADGRCKTFDASADGYVRGEGCGIVVLKRLSQAIRDGDNILALIKGSAINHDGRSNGLTAPNGLSQQAVIRQAWENAKVLPKQISYVEAHGTGTSLGDPIEIDSLKKVIMTDRLLEQPIWIGSVKTNIGHLEAAAGIAGLIKVVLSLQHEMIPRHLNLKQLNPYIDLENKPLSISIEAQKWSPNEKPRLAGVSSFGFGGTNAHIVIEEAPKPTPVSIDKKCFQHLLPLSAKSEKALRELAQSYEAYLKSHPETSLADVCCTTSMGRNHFNQRLVVIAESAVELREHLSAFAVGKETSRLISGQVDNKNSPNIAFLFTGQGSQYLGMGRDLYDTQPIFRASLNRCNEILRPYLEKSLLEVLYPASEESYLLDETAYTQPALFAIEYALFETWKSWGVEPSVVMGHSVGEYVAACVAGIFSLEDGLKLIAERGRLIQGLSQDGEMVSVWASQEKVAVAIEPYAQEVSIAALNGSSSIVISGRRQAIRQVVAALEAEGVKMKNLRVSHAFHSPLMDSIIAEFERIANSITYSTPRLDIISNVTGKSVTSEIATPEYWCRHLRQPVRFVESMETLNQKGYEVFVECGPKPTLLGMGRRCLPEALGVWLPSLRQGKSAWQQMLESFGQLYVQGVSIDWSDFYKDYSYRKIALPTYPFQRERYWFASEREQVFMTPDLAAENSIQKANKTLSNLNIANNKHNVLQETIVQAPVAEKIQNLVSKISKLPPEKLSLKSRIQEDLGFDSLMLAELKTAVITAFPSIQELPLKMLFGGVTVEELANYISENVKDISLSSENDHLSQLDLSATLAKFQLWEKEFQPNKIFRIEKHLVHKHQELNVLIYRIEQLQEDVIIGEVVQDVHHFFFYEHPRDHVPGLYIIEAARQFAISLSHKYYKVPLKTLFVVDELQTQFYKFAESNLPLFMIARIYDKVYADNLLKYMQIGISVVQKQENIASVSGLFRVFDTVKYHSLRKKPKTLSGQRKYSK